MASANFSLGQVNITDYLRVIARKTSNPTVIAASLAPFIPPATAINITIPNLEAVPHYIDFRESVDGIALGTLLATYVYDVKNQQVVAEMRYYMVDGGRAIDPVSGQDTLTDPYLDGKTVISIFKDGVGRPLAAPSETFKEYDFIAGGGFQLLNGQVFSPAEIIVVWITYLVKNPGGGGNNSGGFAGVMIIDHSLTLDENYHNKRIKCQGVGTRLVITMAELSTIPDGAQFYFNTNKGNQLQTKFITQSGELFEHAGEDVQELTLGTGEYLYIIKSELRFEVHQVHENILRVGQRFSGKWKDHLNTMPEDDRLLDGDDYPRIWYWLKNKLPATHKIITTEALIAGLARAVGQENLFIITSDGKKFRMPNAQNWSERGLANFTTYNADAQRDYDYPGGTQKEMVGKHVHKFDIGNGVGGVPIPDYNPVDLNTKRAESVTQENTGPENRVKNIGVIYSTYI